MDLRLQLVRRVAALTFVLLLLCCAGVLAALREDVADEVEASSRLAELMQLAGSSATASDPARVSQAVRRLLDAGRLRHVSVRLERADGRGQEADPDPELEPTDTALTRWLADRVPALPAPRMTHRVPIGDEVLVIRPDPRSEVAEIVHDAVRMLASLLLFAAATLALVWFAAHRALAPVRELELGLGLPPLPRFRLREFDRIARAIDGMALQLAEARAAQHRLAQRLIAVQEDERHELARELHDEIGQSLTAIGVGAAFVDRHAERATPEQLRECARDIAQQARAITGQVRGMLGRLRPHGLEGVGMLAALQELCNGWRLRGGEIRLRAELPDELPPLGPAQGLALYRGLQEALTNVWRHSGAREVLVRLRQAGGERAAAHGGPRRGGGGRRGRPLKERGMIRILLADDHAVVRAGYRRLLDAEPGLTVVGEAASGAEAYAQVVAEPPDVVVLDLNLGDGSGLEVLRRMLAREPALKVLVFSMYDSAAHATQALRAGATGYLTKSSEPGAMIEAVREVAAGRQVIAPDVAQAIAREVVDDDRVFSRLTPREFEVVRMLVRGDTTQRIAEQMHLSPKTVFNYLSLIRQKLGVDSDFKLLHLAMRHGLMS
ncbi:response regulator [Piscinibacter sakaiensis]